jgi:hypothetical protein
MPASLQPPEGLPTPSDDVTDEAWSKMLETQADDARKTAESWRTGLAGLFGLIAVVSVVEGPSEIEGLAVWAAVAAGLLVLLALAAAVAGAWWALEAAYGSPRLVTHGEFRGVGGIVGFRLLQASQSAARLGRAKGATLLSLALGVMAMALVWYGPREVDASVEVTRMSGPPVCGTLLPDPPAGSVDIRTAAGSVRVALGDITRLQIVSGC